MYSLEDGKLVIKDSVLTLGTNTVEIKAEGFKNNTLSVEYKKVLEENLSLVSDKEQYNRGENGPSSRACYPIKTGKIFLKVIITFPN